jgi:hypothetical protein
MAKWQTSGKVTKMKKIEILSAKTRKQEKEKKISCTTTNNAN